MSLKAEIIHHLLKNPLSLADLQQLTDTSLPTVRRAVQTLTDLNWIRVVGQSETNGGRPAMLYGIDRSHYMVFGLQLQLPGIQLIAADLSGTILNKVKFFEKEIPQPSVAVRTIVDAIHDLTSQHENRQVLGLGIASPGFIEQTTGDIIAIGRVPSWKNFPICRHLSESTGLPVQIANDVDCMAIAEFSDENKMANKNLVYIGFCEGVKASLFLDGKLYKGAIGNVGLISPDLLNLGDLSLNTINKQLLTAFGFINTFDNLVSELDISEQKDYQDILGEINEREKFILIMRKALEHDRVCFPLVQKVIFIISIAIANLIYILQPDEIVIGGMLSAMPKALFTNLESSIRQQIPSLISNNLIIKRGAIEPTNNAAIGAIQHFLNSKLNEIIKEN